MTMAEQFVVYYDSGTSNSRIYLLDDQFQVRYTERVNVGSKDTSITGSNLKLLQDCTMGCCPLQVFPNPR